MKSDIPDRTFNFASDVVELCGSLLGRKDVGKLFANQMFRSATSVGANVEEAQGSQSKADFIHKYSIACKEARETHYWLRLLQKTKLVPEERLSKLLQECHEIVAILTSIIKKMRGDTR